VCVCVCMFGEVSLNNKWSGHFLLRV